VESSRAVDFSSPVHAGGAWSVAFRVWYRAVRLVERPLLRLARTRGFGNVVELRVAGRRSGIERSLPLGLLTVGGRWYVGHPSGDTAWTLNLRAAEAAVVSSADIPPTPVRAAVLGAGAERDAVVRATFRQHPFPGNALYRLAGRHVWARGVFLRLERVPPDARPMPTAG
jgi:hypothetical protein